MSIASPPEKNPARPNAQDPIDRPSGLWSGNGNARAQFISTKAAFLNCVVMDAVLACTHRILLAEYLDDL